MLHNKGSPTTFFISSTYLSLESESSYVQLLYKSTRDPHNQTMFRRLKRRLSENFDKYFTSAEVKVKKFFFICRTCDRHTSAAGSCECRGRIETFPKTSASSSSCRQSWKVKWMRKWIWSQNKVSSQSSPHSIFF